MPWTTLTLPHRWRPPVPRWQRRAQWAGVVLAVALAHAWLIEPPGHTAGRPPAPAVALQVVTLLPPVQPVPQPVPQPAPVPDAAPKATPEALPEPAPEPITPPAPRPDEPEPVTVAEQAPPGDPRPVDPFAGPTPPEAVAGSETIPDAEREAPSLIKPLLVAEATAVDAGRAASVAAGELPNLPPPVYRTEPPTRGFKLGYRVEQGDSGGRAVLRVELDEDGPGWRYRAHLQATIPQRTVIDWQSQGRYDAAGVAPERMVERQGGRDVRAVNFQRDKGVISFSSSSRALMLHAGAQDRASLLLQLMAIAQGQPGGLQLGQTLRLQVAHGRDIATEWRFEVAGDEVVEPAGRPLGTWRLVREPTRPYDQRVEVWLARDAHHLPVGLRLATVPGREPLSLWLEGRLPSLGEPRP